MWDVAGGDEGLVVIPYLHVIMALWFGGCGTPRMEWKSIREIHENERKSREQILTFAERHYRCTVKRNGLKINNTIQMYIRYTCHELGAVARCLFHMGCM